MDNRRQKSIIDFVEHNIQSFHEKRLTSLQELKLDKVLKRKNPYLFKAKNIIIADDLVRGLLDAHLSSQEETIFGGFLEELAIFVCSEFFGGKKSAAEGIDLEFDKKDTKYILSIKSGPNWGNSQQISRMKDNFKKAKRILGTNARRCNVIEVNGCCYGRDDNPNKGDYLKLCGQRFWECISGEENLYIDIIEPLGKKAKEKNKKFLDEYSKVRNKFTREFIEKYCNDNGMILWNKLVAMNSKKKQNTDLKY